MCNSKFQFISFRLYCPSLGKDFFLRLFLHDLRSCNTCGFHPCLFLYGISYWFQCVKPDLHLWNETNLDMMHDLLNVLLNSICKVFCKFCFVCVHQGNWFSSFFLVSCSSFCIGVTVSLWNYFGGIFSLCVLQDNLGSMSISPSLYIW